MRILHVNKFLYRRGGAEGYLLDLATLQRGHGHEVAYFGMDHPDNDRPQRYGQHFPKLIELEPPPRGVRARAAAAGRMLYSPSSRRGLAAVLADFRPDVVHLHNIYHQLSPSILAAARDAGVPCVMTLHDYKLACPSYQMLANGVVCDACVRSGPWQAARRRCKDGSLGASSLLAVESLAHRAMRAYGPVQAFISPSRFLAAVMARAGVYPDRMHVVPHFIDVTSVQRAAGPGRGVLFFGRLAPEKGVDVLIEALGRLPDGTALDIAGDGPARAQLQSLAQTRAPGRIRFHGRLDRTALHQLVRSAAVVAVPSRWNENQPMAVLEAFACGVPVVTTDLGGLPELIDDGVDGATVPASDPVALADALRPILADTQRAHAMGLAAREKVQREFSPSAHLSSLHDIYTRAGRIVSAPTAKTMQ